MTEAIMERKLKFTHKFKEFIKKKENKLFLLVVLTLFIIKLYYFFLTFNQALWWDEAEYALLAKHYALGTPATGWAEIRETGFPWILSTIFKIGWGIGLIKFIEVLLSTGSVVLTYFLAKEFFNRKIALISSLFVGLFYLETFYMGRVLLNAPATFAVLLGFFLFWKGYKEDNFWYYSISMIIFLLGLFVYSVIFSGLVAVILFILIVERKKIFKKKTFLKSLVPVGSLAAIIFSYFYITTGHLLPRLAQIASLPEADTDWGRLFFYVQFLPTYLKIPLLIAFIIGLYVFVDLFIGFDLIRENINVQRALYLFLWIGVFFVVVTYNGVVSHVEPRYMMQAFPAVFMIVAFGIYRLSMFVSKYSSEVAVIILILFVISGLYFQVLHGHQLTVGKKDSYYEVKEAGLWFKENTRQGDVIFSTSAPQTTFYSERETYHPNWVETKDELQQEIKEHDAKYFQVSVYEVIKPHVKEYLDSNNFTVAKVFTKNQQPVVIIYKLPQSGTQTNRLYSLTSASIL